MTASAALPTSRTGPQNSFPAGESLIDVSKTSVIMWRRLCRFGRQYRRRDRLYRRTGPTSLLRSDIPSGYSVLRGLRYSLSQWAKTCGPCHCSSASRSFATSSLHRTLIFSMSITPTTGANLYDLVCYLDLEAVVMKPKESKYGESWIKVKNPDYSQIQERQELFHGK
jgi:hypothetical protein